MKQAAAFIGQAAHEILQRAAQGAQVADLQAQAAARARSAAAYAAAAEAQKLKIKAEAEEAEGAENLVAGAAVSCNCCAFLCKHGWFSQVSTLHQSVVLFCRAVMRRTQNYMQTTNLQGL